MSYKAESTISQGCEYMMFITLWINPLIELWQKLTTLFGSFAPHDETSLPQKNFNNIRMLSGKTGYQRPYNYYQLFIYI
jgi:hypothetical protein